MRRLLAVFAHPDDEESVAGSLAHYARQGARVSLACTTRGEAGEISDPSLATPAGLGMVREAELRCACDVIGITDLHLLGYCDSGMMGTPENDRPTAFIQANPDEVRGKLVALMREIRPHIVITFEPGGWYGHPDHIATSRYTTEAFRLAADPAVFPNAGPAWRPLRLFHAAFLRSHFKAVFDYAAQLGMDISSYEELPWDGPDPLEGQITHAMDVEEFLDLKQAAMRCHRTQLGDNNLFARMPPEIMRPIQAHELFIQVEPEMAAPTPWITDLFAGLEGLP